MADIDLTHSHSKGLDGGREAVENVAQQLESELGVNYHWEDDTLYFEGQGADGHIEVDTDVVHLAINLSVFLRPVRKQVKNEARTYLEQHLG